MHNDERQDATSRRGFLGALGLAAGATAAAALPAGASAARSRPATPRAALRALLAGNQRYRSGQFTLRDYSPIGERRASGQAPFAAILTCADSRVSPPLAFDVERGNLFCAHVAGNSVDDGTLGSLEYAVAVLGVRLVMVLGHSDCGAVKAAIDVAAGRRSYPRDRYGAIGAVVDAVVPAVRDLPAGGNRLGRGIIANARLQAATLRRSGPIIAPAVERGDLAVVAALYRISDGRVRVV
jgi:carbonic anhydrase